MSFTDNGRNFQSKKGISFPPAADAVGGSFVAAIAAALQTEFGDTPAAVKVVARLADSNERAARNWFEGKNGPSGSNLMNLMRHSDVVLTVVLQLSHRPALAAAARLPELRAHLAATLAAIDSLAPLPPSPIP